MQRRKDRVEHLREAELGPGYQSMEDPYRPRMSPAVIAAKVGLLL